MNDRKAFILGLFIGVVGSLVPDLASAAQTLNEKPQYSLHVYVSYAALILALIIIYMEVA